MIKDLKNCVRDETGLPMPTTRQYALRSLLTEASFSGQWLKGKEICFMMLAKGYDYGDKPEKAYKEINRDVRFLNVCGHFDKMILGDRAKGYKIATESEFYDWLRRQTSEAKGKLLYLSILAKNAKMDGQSIINLFNQTCLRESKECFVKETDGAEREAYEESAKSGHQTSEYVKDEPHKPTSDELEDIFKEEKKTNGKENGR
jgi:hypothetical protein